MSNGTWRLCWLVLLATQSHVARATLPATYADFQSLTDSVEIKNELEKESGTTAIYLPPGNYFLDNPVVIDRDGSVYVHGAGRISNTKIIALDPTQPLFRIDRATVVNFSNLNIYATQDYYPGDRSEDEEEEDPPRTWDLEARAVLMNNTLPTTLELQFSEVHGSVIDIKGPGTVRLESTGVFVNGLARTGVLVDHPEAEFISLGGGFAGGVLPCGLGCGALGVSV